jgi:hypothetical protein
MQSLTQNPTAFVFSSMSKNGTKDDRHHERMNLLKRIKTGLEEQD